MTDSQILLLVCYHSPAVGALPVSVKKIRPAVVACSSHKWLRGPSGVSLVYIDPTLHESWIPLDLQARGRVVSGTTTWHATSHEIGPNGYPEEFYSDGRKFDAGGKPNPILLPMLRCALESVVKLDCDKIQSTLETLMSPLLTWAESRQYRVPKQPHCWHLIGIQPPNMTTEELLQACKSLNESGVIVSVRCGGFRISPYTTNTTADVDRLIEALERVEKK